MSVPAPGNPPGRRMLTHLGAAQIAQLDGVGNSPIHIGADFCNPNPSLLQTLQRPHRALTADERHSTLSGW